MGSSIRPSDHDEDADPSPPRPTAEQLAKFKPAPRHVPRKRVYLIGSLRNPAIIDAANKIEAATGYEAWASWFAAGPEADDHWKAYEKARGRGYAEALASYAAQHVFRFDKTHLDESDAVVLVLPAGRSGHLELGYACGTGKPAFILLDEGTLSEDRWDVMYNFATGVHDKLEELIPELRRRVG